MGDASVDKVSGACAAVKRYHDIRAQSTCLRELYPDRVLLHLGMNDPRERFEAHVLLYDLLKVREPRDAARSVSAHLGLAPVGIEEPPLEVGLLRRNDHDEPVSADGTVPMAHLFCQPAQVLPLQNSPAVINQYKIVPVPLHFVKRY